MVDVKFALKVPSGNRLVSISERQEERLKNNNRDLSMVCALLVFVKQVSLVLLSSFWLCLQKKCD